MFEEKSPGRIPPDSTARTLKIEETGDFWNGITLPKIRLMGRWLERAGFNPGSHVQVTCVSPGVIELRSHDTAMVMRETPPAPSAPKQEPDCPF